jgi:hypothetical protein
MWLIPVFTPVVPPFHLKLLPVKMGELPVTVLHVSEAVMRAKNDRKGKMLVSVMPRCALPASDGTWQTLYLSKHVNLSKVFDR